MGDFGSKVVLGALALTAAAFSVPAVAQNIVANGDFSSGALPPSWAAGADVAVSTGAVYSSCCNTGALADQQNPFAVFGGGSAANVSTLTQSLTTIAGTSYLLSYRLTALGGGTQSLQASLFDGASTLATRVDAATAGLAFSTYTLAFTAGSSATTLAFAVSPAGSGDGDGIDVILDDVSVSAAPEPATWGMMIVGFGLAGAALRTRRRTAALA